MTWPHWQMAHRAARLEPSTIREILVITERPGIISLPGGLPSSADTVEAKSRRDRSGCGAVRREVRP